jgi:hypothetical protein
MRRLGSVPARDCSKTGCSRPATSTLTFVYDDSTVVVGPLARISEPNAYDLCRDHATRMTAPRGWELIRVPGSADAVDDLVALAHAVGSSDGPGPEEAIPPAPAPGPSRHLSVVRSPDE